MNSLGGSRNRTPLHYASISDHVGVAKMLKEAKADLTIKDKDGYTAINLINGGAMWEVLHQVLCRYLYLEISRNRLIVNEHTNVTDIKH